MDFRLSPAEQSLRDQAKVFLKEALPAGWRGSGAPISDDEWAVAQEFNRKLAAKGYVAPGWPREVGGMGLNLLAQLVWQEQLSYAYAPFGSRQFGVGMIGPMILRYGTEEQKKRFIPGIVSAEVNWCQGYSEPGSGSDLGSLQTRADRDGDHYVLSGQKIWSSNAHVADWAFVLARTDQNAEKHRGISMLLVPTKSNGFSVSPLVNMAGDADFNQMFFDGVQVPVTNRLGDENAGWYMAVELLNHERAGFGDTGAYRRQLDDMKVDLPRTGSRAKLLWSDYADLRARLEATTMLGYRSAWKADSGEDFTNESSAAKVLTSELAGKVAEFGMRIYGLKGQQREDSPRIAGDGLLAKRLMWSTPQTVYSGTNEIQRNIIATRGLGLPRS